ncbi:hypothetical protein J8273_4345 [Carpediemonas membranifera]|uniref:Uncharacterized protein n=1 Tax=Carpediemonas membranifera TaxID=201153 RepID=A0A8J6AU48_9EUKA|nr:hypothetical protein J8273_4345 [Carpediemonas membranifera]|eukprot:KAG9394243.1 hypothetical protein J8273_4345 [Carpediemonas membranifera]
MLRRIFEVAGLPPSECDSYDETQAEVIFFSVVLRHHSVPLLNCLDNAIPAILSLLRTSRHEDALQTMVQALSTSHASYQVTVAVLVALLDDAPLLHAMATTAPSPHPLVAIADHVHRHAARFDQAHPSSLLPGPFAESVLDALFKYVAPATVARAVECATAWPAQTPAALARASPTQALASVVAALGPRTAARAVAAGMSPSMLSPAFAATTLVSLCGTTTVVPESVVVSLCGRVKSDDDSALISHTSTSIAQFLAGSHNISLASLSTQSKLLTALLILAPRAGSTPTPSRELPLALSKAVDMRLAVRSRPVQYVGAALAAVSARWYGMEPDTSAAMALYDEQFGLPTLALLDAVVDGGAVDLPESNETPDAGEFESFPARVVPGLMHDLIEDLQKKDSAVDRIEILPKIQDRIDHLRKTNPDSLQPVLPRLTKILLNLTYLGPDDLRESFISLQISAIRSLIRAEPLSVAAAIAQSLADQAVSTGHKLIALRALAAELSPEPNAQVSRAMIQEVESRPKERRWGKAVLREGEGRGQSIALSKSPASQAKTEDVMGPHAMAIAGMVLSSGVSDPLVIPGAIALVGDTIRRHALRPGSLGIAMRSLNFFWSHTKSADPATSAAVIRAVAAVFSVVPPSTLVESGSSASVEKWAAWLQSRASGDDAMAGLAGQAVMLLRRDVERYMTKFTTVEGVKLV